MNAAKSSDCPDQQTLLQFVQGLLDPPSLDKCESHVSDCEACHETLRGLDSSDTLSHYASEAFEGSTAKELSDTQAIDGLMQRLLQPNERRTGYPKTTNPEMLADRAAEVLRCIEPPAIGDEDSLGTLGNYRLLRLIGAGGTGVVFQATDESLDRIVALKVLRPSLGDIARERFIAEARVAASIEHDNVVTIYQIGQEGRLAFIAMQWLPGETLESKLARQPQPADTETVRQLVTQIASGLAAAHQRQLIHRDVKPANIWICDESNRIKILDFGLARIADEESSLTQTGMLAGTPSFMSPEQTKGMELDPRSDLFSLGCVMYLLLTGKLPFSAPTVLGTLQTIQSDSPLPPKAISPYCDQDLSDLTMSLLEKLPGNRMESAQNLIACLSQDRSHWPQHVATAAIPASSPSEAKPSLQKAHRGFGNWIVAACLLGLLAFPGYLFAPQIFRFATNQGELVIETSDDNIKIEVLENGELVRVLDTTNQSSFDVKAGQYSFNVVGHDASSEFDITPDSVTLKRGGKVIVTARTSATKTASSNGSVATRKPSGSSQTQETLIREAFAMKREIDSQFGAEDTPAKRKAIYETLSAFYQNQKNYLADRLGTGHPNVVSIDKQLESLKMQFEATVEKPIYGGRTFDDWFYIAKHDREPKAVAEAMASCGVLAEGENKKKFVAQLQDLVRKHGTAICISTTQGGTPNTPNTYFTGFVKAIGQLEPQEVVKFIQHEMDSGNERSLGFCGRLFFTLDFNEDVQKAEEFQKIVQLDTRPLMKRIASKELDANTNLVSFLNACFSKSNTIVSVADCKKAIEAIEIESRPEVYQAMLPRFEDGELNQMVVDDFFNESTPGAVRESMLHFFSMNYQIQSYGGGGYLKPWQSKNANTLSIELLTTAIQHVAKSKKPRLTFEKYSEVWFDDHRMIPTSTDSNQQTIWESGDATYSTTRPANARRITGSNAVIRNLLSKLCHISLDKPLEEKERRAISRFAQRLTESTEYQDKLKDKVFEELMIAKDLQALRDFDDGESTTSEFSKFVNTRSQGFFGGDGGGGFGGGGGGGVF